jgi:hypothetical protein
VDRHPFDAHPDSDLDRHQLVNSDPDRHQNITHWPIQATVREEDFSSDVDPDSVGPK